MLAQLHQILCVIHFVPESPQVLFDSTGRKRMVRKHERVIGTLLVWIGVIVSMSMILDRLNYARVMMQNNWYYSGGVVTGASSEEALRLLEDHQELSQQVWSQVNQFAQVELLTYFPYLLLLGAVLLIGGVLSTMFIWRSVVVPEEVAEMVAEKQAEVQESERSLSSLLDDDGEINESNHTQKQRQAQR
jgi:hypothetical protein